VRVGGPSNSHVHVEPARQLDVQRFSSTVDSRGRAGVCGAPQVSQLDGRLVLQKSDEALVTYSLQVFAYLMNLRFQEECLAGDGLDHLMRLFTLNFHADDNVRIGLKVFVVHTDRACHSTGKACRAVADGVLLTLLTQLLADENEAEEGMLTLAQRSNPNPNPNTNPNPNSDGSSNSISKYCRFGGLGRVHKEQYPRVDLQHSFRHTLVPVLCPP